MRPGNAHYRCHRPDVVVDNDNTVFMPTGSRECRLTYVVESFRGSGKTHALVDEMAIAPRVDGDHLPHPVQWIASGSSHAISTISLSMSDRMAKRRASLFPGLLAGRNSLVEQMKRKQGAPRTLVAAQSHSQKTPPVHNLRSEGQTSPARHVAATFPTASDTLNEAQDQSSKDDDEPFDQTNTEPEEYHHGSPSDSGPILAPKGSLSLFRDRLGINNPGFSYENDRRFSEALNQVDAGRDDGCYESALVKERIKSGGKTVTFTEPSGAASAGTEGPPRVLYCCSNRVAAIWTAGMIRREAKRCAVGLQESDVREHFDPVYGYRPLDGLSGNFVVTSPEYFWALSDIVGMNGETVPPPPAQAARTASKSNLDETSLDATNPVKNSQTQPTTNQEHREGYDVFVLDGLDDIIETFSRLHNPNHVKLGFSKFRRALRDAHTVAMANPSVVTDDVLSELLSYRYSGVPANSEPRKPPSPGAVFVYANERRHADFVLEPIAVPDFITMLKHAVSQCDIQGKEKDAANQNTAKRCTLIVGDTPHVEAAYRMVREHAKQKTTSFLRRVFGRTKYPKTLLITEKTVAIPSVSSVLGASRNEVTDHYRRVIEFVRYPGRNANKYDFVFLSIGGLDLSKRGTPVFDAVIGACREESEFGSLTPLAESARCLRVGPPPYVVSVMTQRDPKQRHVVLA